MNKTQLAIRWTDSTGRKRFVRSLLEPDKAAIFPSHRDANVFLHEMRTTHHAELIDLSGDLNVCLILS